MMMNADVAAVETHQLGRLPHMRKVLLDAEWDTRHQDAHCSKIYSLVGSAAIFNHLPLHMLV